MGRARLKLARECYGHRIREIVQGSPCIQHGGSIGRNAGANQHHASESPGVGNRDASRNEAPEGVPDESGPLDRNGVQERSRISGEVVDAVSAIGLFEVAADFSIAETCVFPWCKKFMVMARLRDILAGRQFQVFGAESLKTELLRCCPHVLQSELTSIGRLVLV